MFSSFIKRPVLAIALSLAIVFLGILAIMTRPISQFPEIAPPRVNIFIEFPGSNADVFQFRQRNFFQTQFHTCSKTLFFVITLSTSVRPQFSG